MLNYILPYSECLYVALHFQMWCMGVRHFYLYKSPETFRTTLPKNSWMCDMFL